jgi:hypothetical protein
MIPEKLRGRMEECEWHPPILTFKIERHGPTVNGSSRAPIQLWKVDLEKLSATVDNSGYRRVRPNAPKMDIKKKVEKVLHALTQQPPPVWLKWDGRLKFRLVNLDELIPASNDATKTSRRRRFRKLLTERLAEDGWIAPPNSAPYTYQQEQTSAGG